MPSGEIGDRVTSALGLVQLPGYEKRRVDELSGGQQNESHCARHRHRTSLCSSTSRFQILMLPCGRNTERTRELVTRLGLTAVM